MRLRRPPRALFRPASLVMSTSILTERLATLVASSGELTSPVMVLKARRAEAAKKRESKKALGVKKTGGLARLLPATRSKADERTPDQEVDSYLSGKGVKLDRAVAGEDSNAALALQKTQVDLSLQHRSNRAQRLKLRRARHQIEPVDVSQGPGKARTTLERQQAHQSTDTASHVLGSLRRLRSQRTAILHHTEI